MLNSYKCVICGYIEVGTAPPKRCVVCGASSDDFVIFQEPISDRKENPSSWKCIVCGYIHEGSIPPEVCPVCGVKKDMFEPIYKTETKNIDSTEMDIVIIGSGIAGVTAAYEIRKNSPKANISIISEEKQLPYYRLSLTRYLGKEIAAEDLTLHPSTWFDDNRIKLLLGEEVTEIDRAEKKIRLENKEEINFDKLIITMGAHPFVPPTPGSNLKNVITIRVKEDVDYLLSKLIEIKSCLCIGGGILGLEIAGAIAKNGVKVTLLERSGYLMPRQLNERASGILKDFLHGIGIEVKENARVKEIIGKEYCEGVKLETGEVLKSDLVIITAGVRPNTYLARKAGLDVDKGLLVNDFMQTCDENIYAAGDVCEHRGKLYGLWSAAQIQGEIAAFNVIGEDKKFQGIPSSNVLKILEIDIFSIGEKSLIDGSYYQYEKQSENNYTNFILRDGKIVGSIIMGDKTLALKVKHAVEKGVSFPYELYDNAESIIHKLKETD